MAWKIENNSFIFHTLFFLNLLQTYIILWFKKSRCKKEKLRGFVPDSGTPEQDEFSLG